MIRFDPFQLYLLRRAWFYFLAVLLICSVNFIVPLFGSSSPVDRILERSNLRGMSMAEIDGYREKISADFLLDRPLPIRYLAYMRKMLIPLYQISPSERGYVEGGVNMRLGLNYGKSLLRYPQPVHQILGNSIWWTMLLQIPALALALFCGYRTGAYLAVKSPWIRDGIRGVMFVVSFIPYFCAAFIALYIFAFVLGWFPLMGGFSSSVQPGFSVAFLGSVLHHFLLPFLTLFCVQWAGYTVAMLGAMQKELQNPAIKWERSMGLSDKMLFVAARKSAIVSVVQNIPLLLGFVMGSGFLVEIIFSYPGIGSVMSAAVIGEDFPLIQAGAFLLSLIVIGIHFCVDIYSASSDPRLLIKNSGGR